ncbi:hypothetical protein KJK34_11570 [Flavobacterium sp. D11R37]|uniref:hypothetical protein n=1 Tax=Flavobacterium coralii TaxID=2838017 RepID=UPI001CA5F5F2|nr:hypothetical protein [Flavobacterium coralii]MBY8963392.1 hypothetical protein [Flavobacterium coralii]
MKIIYRNIYDKTITFNEDDLPEVYEKVEVDENTGLTKKIESINNGVVEDIQYYIAEDEDENDIIESYANQGKDSITIIERKIIGNYTVELDKEYDKNYKLVLLSEAVLDSLGNIICLRDLNIVDKQPIIQSTEKYYYDYLEGWGYRRIFESMYNREGSLLNLTYMASDEEQDWEDYDLNNISDLQKRFTNIDYYLNADFLPKGITE